ncbi:uncharacterized protein LOC100384148 [Zea mays]|uniref:Uncharacterized protein n=1 Tax=Zea mays TaxID=4577 RepID=C0PLY3_MAIZE|nr:uncharacterized protein LOC100384148 [Zea mays]ACN36199.1 unknown [Zea mays]|eukprot:NP_001170198.1 uncharacterized protein LOC100384148 [Zea mays]
MATVTQLGRPRCSLRAQPQVPVRVLHCSLGEFLATTVVWCLPVPIRIRSYRHRRVVAGDSLTCATHSRPKANPMLLCPCFNLPCCTVIAWSRRAVSLYASSPFSCSPRCPVSCLLCSPASATR